MHIDHLQQAGDVGEQLHHFHGGLRLHHHKKMSCETPLETVPLPKQLFVPLLQQYGGQAEVTVEAGQKVLKGDVIGTFTQLGSGGVHAPTSGTVKSVVRQPISHPSGANGWCVVIESDGLDRWKELEPLAHWLNADPALLRRKIRNAGIVGLGGAVFPTAFKTDEAIKRGVHTLILNGTECEPYISCDEMLMREQPDSIILGARILQRAVGASRTVIAIEDQMGAVNRALRQAVESAGDDPIKIVKVTSIYPEGGEKQLIQVLTGLEVPAGGAPPDLGLHCQNVATASVVARAVVEGKPLVERIVTVTGNGIRRPRNLVARIGTPVSELVEQCGGYTDNVARLVMGGPMMGYALNSDINPVIMASNCILALTELDIRQPQAEMPCIRCGECARVCPVVLMPQQLDWLIRNGQWDDASDCGLTDCIECGCCDFICPSHIPLVAGFRYGKSELRSLAVGRKQAEKAKHRHEARLQRLLRIKKENHRLMEEQKRAIKDDTKRQLTESISRARRGKKE